MLPAPVKTLPMKLSDIQILYRRELRSAFRDRTIVTNSVLLPMLLYPVIIWLVYTGITFVSGQNEELKSRIMLKDVAMAHALLQKEFANDPAIELVDSHDPAADIQAGALDALVEFVPPKTTLPVDNNFSTRITYDESRDAGNRARNRAGQKISQYRENYLEQQALKLGLSKAEFQRFAVEEQDVSAGRGVGAFAVVLPIFFIIMLAVGAMHPAIDSTAGEREHSTWETMMSTATARSNVLLAKYLYVATMAFIAAFLNLVAMIFSMSTILAPMIGANSALRIPVRSVPVVMAGAVLLALFVAAGMMILASFARNYKEGQSMTSPFYIALIMPVLFLQAPGVEFTTQIALIPVANVMMMIREAFQDVYHWRSIGITLIVEAVCVAAALRIAVLVMRHEDFILGSYNGSFGKFMKERLFKKGA
jgi:sodium transport system permease protein